jgi:hypothetical protein
MADAAAMARAVALLGVLVDSNEGPDMIEVDSKEALFNSALRLEPNNLLALLCARLPVSPPATVKRSGPLDGLLEGVAAHFGWTIRHQPLFTNDQRPGSQTGKMEKWIRTASFTPEAVDRLERVLREEKEHGGDEDEQEDDEDQEEEFSPYDAAGTMKGVVVVRAGGVAEEREGSKKDADVAAGAAAAAARAADKQQEDEKAKKAAAVGVAAAGTNDGAEKELEKGKDAAGCDKVVEEEMGEKDAGNAAGVAKGSGGPAKEKEEEEESDAVLGGNVKPDEVAAGSGGKQGGAAAGGSGAEHALRKVVKTKVSGDDSKRKGVEGPAAKVISSAADEKVLLSGTRWSFLGSNWDDLQNGISVCDTIADLRDGTKWKRGQTVIVQHSGVPDSHHGVIVAVGRCSDKPYVVLFTQEHFEQTPISQDVRLDTNAPTVANEEVEKLWLQFCKEHAAARKVKRPKAAEDVKVEKPQRVQPARAAKGDGVGKKRLARKVPAKKLVQRKVAAVDEEAEGEQDNEEEEEEEADVIQKKVKRQRRPQSKKRNTSKPRQRSPSPIRSRSRSRSHSPSPSPKKKSRHSCTHRDDDDYEHRHSHRHHRSRSRSRSHSRDSDGVARAAIAFAALATALFSRK